jgi:hypothetical protein
VRLFSFAGLDGYMVLTEGSAAMLVAAAAHSNPVREQRFGIEDNFRVAGHLSGFAHNFQEPARGSTGNYAEWN